jgi:hypothetical protein
MSARDEECLIFVEDSATDATSLTVMVLDLHSLVKVEVHNQFNQTIIVTDSDDVTTWFG